LSVQAVAQQILSAQCPPAHCSSIAHAAPWSRLIRQVPASQKKPAWQSPWTAQGAPHELSMHTAGAQLFELPAWQTPAPSQVLAACSVATLQLPGAHSVPALWRRQLPRPSQAPSRPQVVAGSSSHSRPGSSPSVIGRHCPSEPGLSHDRQSPVHRESQQT
jgi:hypothetical protein